MVREGDSCASPPQTRASCVCTECGGTEVGIQGLIAGGVNAPGGEHAPLRHGNQGFGRVVIAVYRNCKIGQSVILVQIRE